MEQSAIVCYGKSDNVGGVWCEGERSWPEVGDKTGCTFQDWLGSWRRGIVWEDGGEGTERTPGAVLAAGELNIRVGSAAGLVEVV